MTEVFSDFFFFHLIRDKNVISYPAGTIVGILFTGRIVITAKEKKCISRIEQSRANGSNEIYVCVEGRELEGKCAVGWTPISL